VTLLLRQHGGYASATDEDLLTMPYARFAQATRLAADASVEAQRGRMTVAAFVGWQVRSAVSMSTKRPPSFQQYLRQLGLPVGPSASAEQVRAEKARAASNVERVREAFAAGRMSKADSG